MMSPLNNPQSTSARRAVPFALAFAIVITLLYSASRSDGLQVFIIAPSLFSAPPPPSTPREPFVSPLDLPVPQEGERRHPTSEGFLDVDGDLPASQHPIFQLIREAKGKWIEKNAAQSKSLEEAVAEYKRRNHGRNPPKGFDAWWDYVEKHNVPLPDEYDRIMKDLDPFRGFSPATLRARMAFLQKQKDTFTLSIRSGILSSHSHTFDSKALYGSEARADGQFDMIESIARHIPDMDAVFNIHDVPTQFVTRAHLDDLHELAEKGEFFDPLQEADRSVSGWGAACPSHSPLYNASLQHQIFPESTDPALVDPDYYLAPSEPPLGAPKSFIVSKDAIYDLCNHPEYIHIHGSLNNYRPEPSAVLLPIFSLSKTNLHSDIMAIPIEQFAEAEGCLHWNEKEEDRLFWRGRNTGGWYNKKTPWRASQRARLARMASYDLPESTVDIIPPPKMIASAMERIADTEGIRLADVMMGLNQGDLNEKMLDVGLAYEAIQCTQEDGSCDEIKKELTFREVVTFDKENHFKFILDVDGNAWSARFKRQLNSNALILKSTIFPEWWTDRIQPWVHYVPIKLDYSDLYDIMAFFQGGGEGEDMLARGIAENGRHWSLTHWRREDMTAYMFRLYLEWARILATDKSSVDFVL